MPAPPSVRACAQQAAAAAAAAAATSQALRMRLQTAYIG